MSMSALKLYGCKCFISDRDRHTIFHHFKENYKNVLCSENIKKKKKRRKMLQAA